MSEEVLTRDYSSGKIHKRFLTASGALASLEADNLDDAGEFEIITADALEGAEPADLCERCFGVKQDGQAG